MINEISAVAFRQNLGEMLNQVQYRHDSILIKKDDKPVAALVDAVAIQAELVAPEDAGLPGLADANDLPVLGTLIAARQGRQASVPITGD